VSRTLIPKGTWTDVPVRIMNVEKRPLPLKPGTVIADLQQVEVMTNTLPGDLDLTTVKRADSKTDTVPDFVQKMVWMIRFQRVLV